MARRYKMTSARRAALRKAQAASARKRRRGGRGRKIAIGVGVLAGAAGVGAAVYLGSRGSKGSKNRITKKVPTGVGPYSKAALAARAPKKRKRTVVYGNKLPRTGGATPGAYKPRSKKQYSGYYGAGG